MMPHSNFRIAAFASASVAVVAAATAATATANPQSTRVYHVPTVESTRGENIEIVAAVSRGWQATLEIRFRRVGARSWNRAPFKRDTETEYRAQIPAEDVVPPGVEYYITSFNDAAEIAHFASAAAPHPIRVREDAGSVLAESELERFEYRRASFRLSGEYVDFGQRETAEGQRIVDRYYRAEADFTYRLFRFPLRAFRLGFTQMLGDTPVTERGTEACPAECQETAGFRAGGWAELRWRLTSFADIDTRVLIQATPDGFGVGGRGELRFGDETASHFAIGGEAITEVGTNVFVRLGWNTVKRFPMAATVELTDYPSAHRDHGVRLIYDLAYQAGHGVRIGARAGYQARDQNIGGVSGGLNVTLDF